MQYLSVFFAIFIAWVSIVVFAATTTNANLVFSLYFRLMIFTAVLFLIGFWRNK